jgi:hypothetical protein
VRYVPALTFDEDWDGQLLTLAVNGTVLLSQTTNGSMVLACENLSLQNNQGTITWTSGGGCPQCIPVPALAKQPTVLVHNWQANDLKLTNTSSNAGTPISVEAFGPGIPGQSPKEIPPGTPVPFQPMQTGQTATPAGWFGLKFQLSASQLAVFAFIGGPLDASGNNAYVISINAPQTTGPGTGLVPPPGYYATTVSNTYTYVAKWSGAEVWVVFLGSASVLAGGNLDPPPTVTLLDYGAERRPPPSKRGQTKWDGPPSGGSSRGAKVSCQRYLTV